MPKKFTFILVFIIATIIIIPQSHAIDPKVAALSKSLTPIVNEPAIQIRTFPNGLKIYYLQDTELPIVQMKTYLKLGKLYEQEVDRGITEIFMSIWRTGGTKTRTPKEIDEEIAFLAMILKPFAGGDLSYLNTKFLEKDAQKALAIYFDIMRNPAFDADRLALIKKNKISDIKTRNEEGIDIAFREFYQKLYGEKSPHAWLYTEETIKKIDQESLKKFYAENIAPNQMMMAVVAPYTFDEFLSLITPHIQDWQTKLPDKKWPTKVVKTIEPSIDLIEKSGNQTAIVMGHFAEKRFNPDKFKIILGNEMLAGSTFGSRVGSRLRSDLGLVYNVGSTFGFQTDYGSFYIGTKTKNETVVTVVEEVKKILKDFIKGKDLNKDELEAARERIVNRLVFSLEKTFEIVCQRLTFDYYGYPPNYTALFQKEIEAVTLDDVKTTLSKYYFPDSMRVMLVGEKDKITDIKKLKGLKERKLDLE